MAGSKDEVEQLLRRYGIDRQTVELMYAEWHDAKVPKSVVEARYLRTRKHHGKLFNRLMRLVLAKETQNAHPLRARVEALETEVDRLRSLLAEHGIEYPRDVAVSADQISLFEGDRHLE